MAETLVVRGFFVAALLNLYPAKISKRTANLLMEINEQIEDLQSVPATQADEIMLWGHRADAGRDPMPVGIQFDLGQLLVGKRRY